MILKVNGKVAAYNGHIGVLRTETLNFEVDGSHFPATGYQVGQTGYRTGWLIISSHTPNSLTINYGDGTVLTEEFEYTGNYYSLIIADVNSTYAASAKVKAHAYTDGNEGKRVVSFKFRNPRDVYQFNTSYARFIGKFPENIDRLGLEALSLNYTHSIDSFPFTIANTAIWSLQLAVIGPGFNTALPLELLRMQLKVLAIQGATFLGGAFTSTNFNRINLLKDTLEELNTSGTNSTALPEELLECTNLKVLSINSNLFAEVPPLVNQMTQLTSLDFVGGFNWNNAPSLDYGYFGGLINLEKLYTRARLSTATPFRRDIPVWFTNLTKLKYWNFEALFHSAAHLDEFISNIYSFVVANAPISGDSSAPFRGMVFTNASSLQTAVPTGTYQQPAGYVQGSSNGTPVNSKEHIWVLVNQYGHSWTLQGGL